MEKNNRSQNLFINPYNFIGLSDAPKREKEEAGERYTGYIEYSLTTRSSLFIPNTTSDKAFRYEKNQEDDPKGEHSLYDFFSYNILDKDKVYDEEYFLPVIPGSEVRGMIRSIYETLTNSCLSVVDGEKRIGKRTVEYFKPGILKWDNNGDISLYSARDAIYRDKNDFSKKYDRSCPYSDGAEVSFTKSNPPKSYIKPNVIEIFAGGQQKGKRGNLYTGYLLKGNKGPEIAPGRGSKCISRDGKQCIMLQKGLCKGNQEGEKRCYLAEKHCAHVFYLEEQPKQIAFPDNGMKSLGTLEVVLEQYLTEDPGSYAEYKKAFKRFKSGEAKGLPVYYSKIENLDYIMLAPACITREVYSNTVNTLVKAHAKCNSKERRLCPACRLFGTVNSNVAQGSKIRFTDLVPAKEEADYKAYYDGQLMTLEALAVPHLSNTEFYLQKPADPEGEVWFWTYDYYTVKTKDGTVKVKTYKDTPAISGRKFYWNNLAGVATSNKQTALNRTVRTVHPGVEFTGRIYFDEISKKQLEQLVYIVTYTADGKHGYKLGTGKPLGLGSVELQIKETDGIMIRAYEQNTYTLQIPETSIRSVGYQEAGFDRKVETAFELMTRYLEPADMRHIHYPITGKGDDEEGFQWFMANKKNYRLDKDGKLNGGKAAETNSPNDRRQTRICQTLPSVAEGEIPWLKKTGDIPSHAGNSRPLTPARDKYSKPEHKKEQKLRKVYKARIISEGRPNQLNQNFLEYDIELLDAPSDTFKNRCTLSAHRKVGISYGKTVDVIQFRGSVFNLPR